MYLDHLLLNQAYPNLQIVIPFQIKYKNVTERVVNVQRSEYSSGQFLTIEITSQPGAEEMNARITATERMDLLHYIVIGRGDILLAKTLEVNTNIGELHYDDRYFMVMMVIIRHSLISSTAVYRRPHRELSKRIYLRRLYLYYTWTKFFFYKNMHFLKKIW